MSRRIGVRIGGKKRNRRKFNFSLKGDEGRRNRRVLIIALALIAAVAAIILLKPKNQLMHSAEMRRIVDNGVLVVGVRGDVPHFAENGEGFEIELAGLFARYLLPDTGSESAVKLVRVSGATAETKLSDGSIDAAIALMQKGASGKFAYSYPYYSDVCVAAVLEGNENKPVVDMLIGYVQNTSGANALTKYVSARETKVERTLIDKIFGRKAELPENAVVCNRKAFASYPDMLTALKNGSIDCAAIPGVYFERYREEYGIKAHTESFGNIDYAIAVSSDEPAIAQLADVFIYELKQSGALDDLLNKYELKGTGS